jgi:hypothetical protein
MVILNIKLQINLFLDLAELKADTIMDMKATTTELVDVEDTIMDIPMVTRRLILISELLLFTLLETCSNQ